MSDTPKTCLTDGSAPSPGYDEIKENGQQVDYLVLCPEERAKGYVRPLRTSYIHVGPQPKYPLRDLTDEERERFPESGYVKYEEYPNSEAPKRGRFWKQSELDNNGCGSVTTMSKEIAETYARNPRFYGGTFCCGCGKHFPVQEFVWDPDGTIVGS